MTSSTERQQDGRPSKQTSLAQRGKCVTTVGVGDPALGPEKGQPRVHVVVRGEEENMGTDDAVAVPLITCCTISWRMDFYHLDAHGWLTTGVSSSGAVHFSS